MWRYLVGGIAGVLMVAAGWSLFTRGAGGVQPLPAAPQAVASAAPDAELPDAVPEASARTREQKRFDRYDKDRDGRITRDEYLALRRKAYAKLDANGDGRLSFEEWASKSLGKFGVADRDRSGAMDAEEFSTTAMKRKPATRCACPPAAAADE